VAVLVLGPYPPMRDGIGVYVRDAVERMRASSEGVTVLSPLEGNGDLRAPFLGGRAFERARRLGGTFDRVVVHFQPSLYYRPRRPVSKIATSIAFLRLAVAHGPKLEVVVHEADPPALWRPDYLLLRAALRRAGVVSFHTERERRDFEREYHTSGRGRVVPHVVGPAEGTAPSRREARTALGLPHLSAPVFICAGFLQPSKGYDRAVNAFGRLRARAASGSRNTPSDAPPASLYVVGTVREPTSENLAYAADLRARCEAIGGATLVERFVDDREFDLWVAAADRLVLPYRRAWSSGVLARAHALGTPALVADAGGLAEQAGSDDVVFSNDEELERAMQDVVDG